MSRNTKKENSCVRKPSSVFIKLCCKDNNRSLGSPFITGRVVNPRRSKLILSRFFSFSFCVRATCTVPSECDRNTIVSSVLVQFFLRLDVLRDLLCDFPAFSWGNAGPIVKNCFSRAALPESDVTDLFVLVRVALFFS